MQHRPLLTALAATVLAAAFAAPAQAALFNLSFDGTFDGSFTPPIVGTGTFSFTGNATAGTTVALSSLADVAFSATVAGVTFDLGDLQTTLSTIQVRFTAVGSDLFANFAGSGGPLNGSMDFVNSGNILSLEPNFGSRYFAGSTNLGTFQAVLAPTVAVPEPGSIVLAGLALAALATARRRA